MQNKDFSMQPNRQPDGILTDNSPCISKRELHLFGFFLRQFRKAVQRICSGCHDLVVTLPAFLPAISGKMPWICELLPAHNGVIHNIVNFTDFPLLRLIKWMIQGFFIKHLGADHISIVTIQESLNHTSFRIFRHELLLKFFQILFHFFGKGKLILFRPHH